MLTRVSLVTLLLVFCAGALFGQGARIVMETATELATRSIPVSAGGGLFVGDTQFSYDSAAHFLGLGTASPGSTLHISGGSYPQVRIDGLTNDPTNGNVWLRFMPGGEFRFFDFSAGTVDGADTKVMRLGGGGDVTTDRGAVLELDGNEGGGSATLRAGDSGGFVMLDPGMGDVKIGKPLVALGNGPTATLGATGGTGPTSSAQNSWLRLADSTGQAIWIPVYK